MSQVKQVTSKAIPVVGTDIDTDRIIPARFLRCVTFDGLGEHAFADDRQQENGQHPFDLSVYQGAKILVVNTNFGCGSSREHAPQALSKWGIQAIIGESFAEIFLGNCVSIGVPCVTTDSKTVQKLQQLIQANPQVTVGLDLEAMQVSCGDFSANVTMNEGSRQMMIEGTWDSCGQLVNRVEQIQVTASKLPYIDWSVFNPA